MQGLRKGTQTPSDGWVVSRKNRKGDFAPTTPPTRTKFGGSRSQVGNTLWAAAADWVTPFSGRV